MRAARNCIDNFHCHSVCTQVDIPLGEGNGTPFSSTAWKIPWTEEPGGPQSMGSLRVRHDWATSLLLFTFVHWRRKWRPTPVFLPGESQGRGAWWAAVYGVTQSRTWLKWLSSSRYPSKMSAHPIVWASQVALVVKNLPSSAGDIIDAGLIPGSGRSPGGGHGNPLQYSCLGNPMDRGLWWATIQGVTESWCFCLEFSRSYCLVSKRNFILC